MGMDSVINEHGTTDQDVKVSNEKARGPLSQ